MVDAVSMALMNGATVDFSREIIGSQFRIVDNPQVSMHTQATLQAALGPSVVHCDMPYERYPNMFII